jgi:erythrocyte band 7 integral membrane protein
LAGIERFFTFIIVGFFYLLFLFTLPLSLLVCLKKISENERVVVYRLGRLITPAYKPGYCILFPLIDNYQRFNIVQKEFALTNLQILNYENSIIDISTNVRYRINDVVKMTNSVQDLTITLKSLSRGILVNLLSKLSASKIEKEINYIKQDFTVSLNEQFTMLRIIIHLFMF